MIFLPKPLLALQREKGEVTSESEKRLTEAVAATERLQEQLHDARLRVQEAEAKLVSAEASAQTAASAAAAELSRAQAAASAEAEKVADLQVQLEAAQTQVQERGGDISVAAETIRLREAALEGVTCN